MDRLLKPADVAEILGCKRDKAISVMRKIRHIDLSEGGMRANLRCWERDLKSWLDEKTERPQVERKRGRRPKTVTGKGGLIPYRKAE